MHLQTYLCFIAFLFNKKQAKMLSKSMPKPIQKATKTVLGRILKNTFSHRKYCKSQGSGAPERSQNDTKFHLKSINKNYQFFNRFLMVSGAILASFSA